MEDSSGQVMKLNENYWHNIANKLLSFQISGLFCDTALVARDQKLVYAHSCVLSSACQNLSESLNQRPFFKPVPNVIDLTQFAADVIERFVLCIYTGNFNENQSTELQELCEHLGVSMGDKNELDENADQLVETEFIVKGEESDYFEGEVTLIENKAPFEYDIDLDAFNSHCLNHQQPIDSLCGEDKSITKVSSSRTRRHRRHNLKARPYVCCECIEGFRTPVQLKIHVFSVHAKYKNVKPFQCKLCGKTCTSYEILKKHIDSHLWHVDGIDVKSNLICGYCRKVFKYEQSLISHVRVHEMNGNVAPNCETGVNNYHLGVPKRKPPRKIHICPLCNKGFRGPARLRVHLNRHTGALPHVCNICGKGFANAEYIKKHKLIHSGNRGHKCTICDKSFFSQSSLLCHMNTHTGAKPYRCEVCQRGFSQVSSFIKHRKTHTESSGPSHLCQLCGKQFASWTSYSVHVRKHTGERPYACEECGKRFIRLYDLQIHQFDHTQLFPYVCSECNRGFGNGSKLKRHMLSAHTPDTEKPFRCSYCSKGFAENYLLKQHWRYHFKSSA